MKKANQNSTPDFSGVEFLRYKDTEFNDTIAAVTKGFY